MIQRYKYSLFCTVCEKRIWLEKKPSDLRPSKRGFRHSWKVERTCCGKHLLLVPHLEEGDKNGKAQAT